jgi:hypothetical protein
MMQKKYFLYYADGSWEDGNVGLEQFDKLSDALAWINARGRCGTSLAVDRYTLIYGTRVPLEPQKIVTEIGVPEDW